MALKISVEDVAGLSKPLTRLIEVVSQGVGAVSQPYLTRRNADAEAYRIERIGQAIKQLGAQHQLPVVYDEGKIEVWQKPEDGTLVLGETTLAERTQSRIDFRERKRQANIETVTSAAADELADEEDVPNEHPDDDWISRFFDNAQDVSTEHMQHVWGRLLAGEIRRPGSFSFRTLDFVRNLSTSDAKLIERVLLYCLIPSGNKESSGIFSDEKYLKENADINFSTLLYLDDLGLINATKLSLYGFAKPDNPYVIFHGDHALVLSSEDQERRYELPMYKLGRIGVELLDLLTISVEIEYLRIAGQHMQKNGGHAKIVKVVEWLPDGRIRYDDVEDLAEKSK